MTASSHVPRFSVPLGVAVLLNIVIGFIWGIRMNKVSLFWIQEIMFYSVSSCVFQWIVMAPFLWIATIGKVKLASKTLVECCWMAFCVSLLPIPLGVEYSPPLLPIIFLIVWCPCICICLILNWMSYLE